MAKPNEGQRISMLQAFQQQVKREAQWLLRHARCTCYSALHSYPLSSFLLSAESTMAAYSCSRPVQEVSNEEEVDAILKSLQDACGPWHAMPRRRKIALLQLVRGRAIKASVDLGKATAKVRTLPSPQRFEISACLRRESAGSS